MVHRTNKQRYDDIIDSCIDQDPSGLYHNSTDILDGDTTKTEAQYTKTQTSPKPKTYI